MPINGNFPMQYLSPSGSYSQPYPQSYLPSSHSQAYPQSYSHQSYSHRLHFEQSNSQQSYMMYDTPYDFNYRKESRGQTEMQEDEYLERKQKIKKKADMEREVNVRAGMETVRLYSGYNIHKTLGLLDSVGGGDHEVQDAPPTNTFNRYGYNPPITTDHFAEESVKSLSLHAQRKWWGLSVGGIITDSRIDQDWAKFVDQELLLENEMENIKVIRQIDSSGPDYDTTPLCLDHKDPDLLGYNAVPRGCVSIVIVFKGAHKKILLEEARNHILKKGPVDDGFWENEVEDNGAKAKDSGKVNFDEHALQLPLLDTPQNTVQKIDIEEILDNVVGKANWRFRKYKDVNSTFEFCTKVPNGYRRDLFSPFGSPSNSQKSPCSSKSPLSSKHTSKHSMVLSKALKSKDTIPDELSANMPSAIISKNAGFFCDSDDNVESDYLKFQAEFYAEDDQDDKEAGVEGNETGATRKQGDDANASPAENGDTAFEKKGNEGGSTVENIQHEDTPIQRQEDGLAKVPIDQEDEESESDLLHPDSDVLTTVKIAHIVLRTNVPGPPASAAEWWNRNKQALKECSRAWDILVFDDTWKDVSFDGEDTQQAEIKDQSTWTGGAEWRKEARRRKNEPAWKKALFELEMTRISSKMHTCGTNMNELDRGLLAGLAAFYHEEQATLSDTKKAIEDQPALSGTKNGSQDAVSMQESIFLTVGQSWSPLLLYYLRGNPLIFADYDVKELLKVMLRNECLKQFAIHGKKGVIRAVAKAIRRVLSLRQKAIDKKELLEAEEKKNAGASKDAEAHTGADSENGSSEPPAEKKNQKSNMTLIGDKMDHHEEVHRSLRGSEEHQFLQDILRDPMRRAFRRAREPNRPVNTEYLEECVYKEYMREGWEERMSFHRSQYVFSHTEMFFPTLTKTMSPPQASFQGPWPPAYAAFSPTQVPSFTRDEPPASSTRTPNTTWDGPSPTKTDSTVYTGGCQSGNVSEYRSQQRYNTSGEQAYANYGRRGHGGNYEQQGHSSYGQQEYGNYGQQGYSDYNRYGQGNGHGYGQAASDPQPHSPDNSTGTPSNSIGNSDLWRTTRGSASSSRNRDKKANDYFQNVVRRLDRESELQAGGQNSMGQQLYEGVGHNKLVTSMENQAQESRVWEKFQAEEIVQSNAQKKAIAEMKFHYFYKIVDAIHSRTPIAYRWMNLVTDAGELIEDIDSLNQKVLDARALAQQESDPPADGAKQPAGADEAWKQPAEGASKQVEASQRPYKLGFMNWSNVFTYINIGNQEGEIEWDERTKPCLLKYGKAFPDCVFIESRADEGMRYGLSKAIKGARGWNQYLDDFERQNINN